MASFDSTIGINRNDLEFDASFTEVDKYQAFKLTIRNPLMGDGVPADYFMVHVSSRNQLHA